MLRLLALLSLMIAAPAAAQTTAGRVMPVPLTGTGSGLQSAMSSASSGTVWAGPSSFYGFTVTLVGGQGPGWFMLFDSATVPADGAVMPVRCIYVDAGPRSTVFGSSGFPLSLVRGLSWAFSSGPSCTVKAEAPANFVAISYKVQQ